MTSDLTIFIIGFFVTSLLGFGLAFTVLQFRRAQRKD